MQHRRRSKLTYENFTVTLERDRRVYVDGCKAILKYENDKVVLKLSSRTLSVCGSCLMLKSFSQSELCVSGKISSVILGE